MEVIANCGGNKVEELLECKKNGNSNLDNAFKKSVTGKNEMG